MPKLTPALKAATHRIERVHGGNVRTGFAARCKHIGRSRTRTVHDDLSGKVHATGSKPFRKLANGTIGHGQKDEPAVAGKAYH